MADCPRVARELGRQSRRDLRNVRGGAGREHIGFRVRVGRETPLQRRRWGANRNTQNELVMYRMVRLAETIRSRQRIRCRDLAQTD
jgi:hypothetical protein